MSLKIARCQKSLLNYEEALVILKTCFKNIKKKTEKNHALIVEYFHVSNEYIGVLMLLNRLEEAHDVGWD